MGKGQDELFEVQCPCCQASLKVDPRTRAVISHKAVEKPRTMEDMDAAITFFKGEASRRAPGQCRRVRWLRRRGGGCAWARGRPLAERSAT